MLLRFACLVIATAALAACERPGAPVAARTPPASATALVVPAPIGTPAATGIAWLPASTDAEVDAAFARARTQEKPVLLYWGAEWCPPCNQLKATLFNRQDFIERTRAFVPVYVDGDRPGAQKLGARFKVRGYPTLVLLSPAGQELTRLPGEVDAQQITQVLTLGLAMQRPVKAVLADARAGRALSASEWQLLAFYSWDTDAGDGQAQVLPPKALPAALRELAAACPPAQAEAGTRLFLKAWAAAEAPRPDAKARERFLAVLRSAEASRVQMDVLANHAEALAKAFAPAGDKARTAVIDAFDASLAGLANDVTLSRADRASASIARVQLARLDAARGVPPALMTDIREQVARLDRETTDGYERQAVIPTLAYLLREAGAGADSDALLKANLARSHSPYYLMSSLASNAKKRGDHAEALRWSEEAWRRSEGQATRLQWGAAHVATLVELAPQDEARIEATALQVLREAAAQPNAFYERSARSLQRVADTLATWQKKTPGHADAMARLRTELDALCAAVPEADGQRDACRNLLNPKKASA
jgi:thiol-disulfide isomerase/thioredoxin